ncbi:MAG: DUF3604 domain-containing protein [Verrucomicrobiae bacterium]|nr:DUF3604 domain-containing protein [Verrucomicrobiae bacterium]
MNVGNDVRRLAKILLGLAAVCSFATTVAAETVPAWRRPIRIPEEIPLTRAEPPVAVAGEMVTLRLPLQLARDVPPDATLKLQLWGGRNNKGTFPGAQVRDPKADGYVSARADDGTPIAMRPDKQAGTFVLQVPPNGLRKGQTINVILGDRSGGSSGIRVQNGRLLNKFFVLYAVGRREKEPQLPQWAGSSVWGPDTWQLMVAACTMHILGGKIERLRVYVPASTRPAQPFPVLVRPEDKFGNLSSEPIRSVSVLLNGKPLPAQIEKVPDSTCLRAIVSLPQEGVFRLTVREDGSGIEAESNPTRCSNDGSLVCWGIIHCHTELSDGTGSIDQYFHQVKNEVLLDFAASSDHDHLFETPDGFWEITQQAVKRWNKPPEFVAFLGYEWAKWRRNGDGDRNVYFLEGDRPMYRSDDGHYATPPELFGALRKANEGALVIVHHPAHGGNFCDWKDHDPEYEKLVEIYQNRGSYECAPKEGNTHPERPGKTEPFPTGYVRNALALGWRVGFAGGGDDHAGHWGTEFLFGAYKQGLMSVEANERSRAAIFEAMRNRRVVATTGKRMLLTYTLNGHPFGTELLAKDNPRRKLQVEFHGTAPVKQIDIIRNNRVVHSHPGNGQMDIRFMWEDTEPIQKTWLPPAKFCPRPFTFYYVRVTQTDGEVAWASPTWIDP